MSKANKEVMAPGNPPAVSFMEVARAVEAQERRVAMLARLDKLASAMIRAGTIADPGLREFRGTVINGYASFVARCKSADGKIL
jgi:hypothetical protein